jgi:hypothetical protein
MFILANFFSLPDSATYWEYFDTTMTTVQQFVKEISKKQTYRVTIYYTFWTGYHFHKIIPNLKTKNGLDLYFNKV